MLCKGTIVCIVWRPEMMMKVGKAFGQEKAMTKRCPLARLLRYLWSSRQRSSLVASSQVILSLRIYISEVAPSPRAQNLLVNSVAENYHVTMWKILFFKAKLLHQNIIITQWTKQGIHFGIKCGRHWGTPDWN